MSTVLQVGDTVQFRAEHQYYRRTWYPELHTFTITKIEVDQLTMQPRAIFAEGPHKAFCHRLELVQPASEPISIFKG